MIEANKMLHLSRYVILFRISTKSRVTRCLHSSSCETTCLSPRKGYAHRYAHNGIVQKTYIRAGNYIATCSKTFSTSVSQSSVDDVDHKVTSLCDDINNGQVSADNLKEIIKLCNESDYQLNHSTGILLLRCCGKLLAELDATERQRLADQVWQLARRDSKELTAECYNTLLSVHMDNSKSIDPEEFLAKMSVEPNKDTYCLLLNIAIKTGNNKYVQDIMSLIKEKNIAIDEEAYNAMAQMYATLGNVTDIEHVLTLMKKNNLSTNKVYTELACGYAKLGDIPNLVQILNDEPQNNDNLLKIIYTLSTNNNGRHILVVLNFLTPSTSDSEVNKVITKLIHTDQIADAYVIINYLATKDATKNLAKSLANNFLNKLVILNLPIDNIMKYASDFVDSGCEPLALTNLAEIALKLSRENLCLATFQTMKEKGIEVRPHYYWPLLIMAHYGEGEGKIFSLVKTMINTGVELDSDTLTNFVYPYINTVDPAVTMQKMLLNNVPSVIAYTPLIIYLLSKNRLKDIILYSSYVRFKPCIKDLIRPLLRAYFGTKNSQKCVSLLASLPDGRNFTGLFLISLLNDNRSNTQELYYFLKEFSKHEMKISPRDATNLKARLPAGNLMKNQNLFKLIDDMVDNSLEEITVYRHPMYMNIKELNCLLVEFESKEWSTKGVLRWLLDSYCHENNFKKCEEIKEKFDACKYEWTPGLKMNLFEVYIKTKKLKEAENLLLDMGTSEGFQMDNIKIVMFAHALIEADKVDKAFQVIKTYVNVDQRMDVQKYCQLLLEALAQSKYHARTEDMLLLLLQNGYCNVSMKTLRPLVRIPLERNDIPAAIDTFNKCVEKYKRAPLGLELLTVLLQQKDNPQLLPLSDVNHYLEQVYNMTNDLYGNESANTQLALALAKLNKTQELENILQNQRLCMESIKSYYSYVRRNDEIDSLVTLFKMITDTSNLDKAVISEMLLSFYVKQENNNGILELWKMMSAKNIKPNKKFEQMIIQHFVLNKMPLPPGFEQDRSEISVSNF